MQVSGCPQGSCAPVRAPSFCRCHRAGPQLSLPAPTHAAACEVGPCVTCARRQCSRCWGGRWYAGVRIYSPLWALCPLPACLSFLGSFSFNLECLKYFVVNLLTTRSFSFCLSENVFLGGLVGRGSGRGRAIIPSRHPAERGAQCGAQSPDLEIMTGAEIKSDARLTEPCGCPGNVAILPLFQPEGQFCWVWNSTALFLPV